MNYEEALEKAKEYEIKKIADNTYSHVEDMKELLDKLNKDQIKNLINLVFGLMNKKEFRDILTYEGFNPCGFFKVELYKKHCELSGEEFDMTLNKDEKDEEVKEEKTDG